jgi:alcohol dehydrogenase class IV
VADLHHGLANGIMIDHVMRFNLPAASEKMAELAHVVGVAGNSTSTAAQAFIDWLVALKGELSIPLTLAQYQSKRAVTRADIPALVEVAVNDTCHQTNPRPCARSDFERIFAAAL